MNASELAMKMLKWEAMQEKIEALEDEIAAAVKQIGKTQNVGRVRATYSAGRRTFDYQTAAEGHPMVNPSTLALFSKTTVDWKKVCEHVGIPAEEIPFTQGEPSVSIKLVG